MSKPNRYPVLKKQRYYQPNKSDINSFISIFSKLKIITIMYENELGEYIDIFLMMDDF